MDENLTLSSGNWGHVMACAAMRKRKRAGLEASSTRAGYVTRGDPGQPGGTNVPRTSAWETQWRQLDGLVEGPCSFGSDLPPGRLVSLGRKPYLVQLYSVRAVA